MKTNQKAKQLLLGKKIITVYLHSDKEIMYQAGKESGLSEEQLDLFKYALAQVEFDLLVDDKGNAEILLVQGKKLK